MTPHQIAQITRVAELIEEADAILNHQFWMTLPKGIRDRIEAIPGMDYFDRTLANKLRQIVQHEQENVR